MSMFLIGSSEGLLIYQFGEDDLRSSVANSNSMGTQSAATSGGGISRGIGGASDGVGVKALDLGETNILGLGPQNSLGTTFSREEVSGNLMLTGNPMI